jgi:hypothetical protein
MQPEMPERQLRAAKTETAPQKAVSWTQQQRITTQRDFPRHVPYVRLVLGKSRRLDTFFHPLLWCDWIGKLFAGGSVHATAAATDAAPSEPPASAPLKQLRLVFGTRVIPHPDKVGSCMHLRLAGPVLHDTAPCCGLSAVCCFSSHLMSVPCNWVWFAV